MTTQLTTNYDPETLAGGWRNVADFIVEARLVAFDGCHKIYLAMDDIEEAWFRNEYDIIVDRSADYMWEALVEWFDESCGLRFIEAVYHNGDDPNDGFVRLIAQFADDE